MTSGELTERVRELRERGRTPKEIARALGLPPAEIAPVIRAVAATRPREEAALAGCWVSQGWSTGLGINGHDDWPGTETVAGSSESGLVTILVARGRGSTITACNYLVDCWCLGVKNAAGPTSMNRRKVSWLVSQLYRTYVLPPVPAPIELARHLVFGAVEYARGLGFEPHADFAECASHLGPWDGRSDITFGRDGEPFYIEGPYDDARRVMRTLRKARG